MYVTPFYGLWILFAFVWLASLAYQMSKPRQYCGNWGDGIAIVFEGMGFLIWTLFLLVFTLTVGYFL